MSALIAVGAVAVGGALLGALGLGASKKAQKTADDAKNTATENRQLIEQLGQKVNGLQEQVGQLQLANAYQRGLLEGGRGLGPQGLPDQDQIGQQGGPHRHGAGFGRGLGRQQAAFRAGYGLGLADGLTFSAPIWNHPDALLSGLNARTPGDFLRNLDMLCDASPLRN